MSFFFVYFIVGSASMGARCVTQEWSTLIGLSCVVANCVVGAGVGLAVQAFSGMSLCGMRPGLT